MKKKLAPWGLPTLLCVLSVGIVSNVLAADTFTWMGGGGSGGDLWDNKDNWTSSGLPGFPNSGDLAVFPDPTTIVQTVQVDGTYGILDGLHFDAPDYSLEGEGMLVTQSVDSSPTTDGANVIGTRLVVTGATDPLTVGGGTLELHDVTVVSYPAGDAVSIGADATLKAAGTINRRVAGFNSSQLWALGDLSVGDVTRSDGYNFGGKLSVGPYLVGLMDADEAELRGATLAGGALSSLNGIRLLARNPTNILDTCLRGHGIVKGNLTLGAPSSYPAFVWGQSVSDKIELAGFVRGVGIFMNVNITGCYRPGWSAAYVAVGGGTAITHIRFEIGGTTPGSVTDPGIFGEFTAGDYTQVYAFGNLPGQSHSIPVTGAIAVVLADGFVPAQGDEFVLVQSGPFEWLDFSMLPPADLEYDAAGVSFDFAGAPLPEGLRWEVSATPDQVVLSVVPEPGSLVLMASGGIALLLFWRRRPY